jgi:hypothetical protein
MPLYVLIVKIAHSYTFNTPFPESLAQVHETIVAAVSIRLFYVARDYNFTARANTGH